MSAEKNKLLHFVKYLIHNLTVSFIHGVRNFLFFFSFSDWFSSFYYRPFLFRLFGGRCGKKVSMGRCRFSGPTRNITVGDYTYINDNVFFNVGGKVTIGDRAAIGFGSCFVTGTHKIGNSDQRCGELYHEDIIIENGVWIAAYVLVNPGVTIGKGTIVSSGAVVNRTMPPDVLAAGNPARVVQKYAEDNKILEKE